MTYPEKTRSNAWFLLPIFFSWIGGLIAYFILRHDDPPKAKNCLYLGIALTVIGLIIQFIIFAAMPDIGSGFNVNI